MLFYFSVFGRATSFCFLFVFHTWYKFCVFCVFFSETKQTKISQKTDVVMIFCGTFKDTYKKFLFTLFFILANNN